MKNDCDIERSCDIQFPCELINEQFNEIQIIKCINYKIGIECRESIKKKKKKAMQLCEPRMENIKSLKKKKKKVNRKHQEHKHKRGCCPIGEG